MLLELQFSRVDGPVPRIQQVVAYSHASVQQRQDSLISLLPGALVAGARTTTRIPIL